MAEYIERKRAIVDACNSLNLYPSEYARLEDAITKIPAADVAPVRHGRWIILPYTEQYKNKCSNCEKGSDLETEYCPNCGAKMDMEEWLCG